jgi:hypothetical protein
MMQKSGHRFSDKIMLKTNAKLMRIEAVGLRKIGKHHGR